MKQLLRVISNNGWSKDDRNELLWNYENAAVVTKEKEDEGVDDGRKVER